MSLRWRLTAAFLGVLVVALAAVGVFQYFALRNFLMEAQASTLRAQLRVLGPATDAVTAAAQRDYRAAVYDQDGNQLALSDPGPQNKPWIEPHIQDVVKGGYQLYSNKSTHVMAVATSVGLRFGPRSPGTTGYLVVEGSTEPTETALSGDLLTYGVSAIVALLLAGGAGIFLTSRSLRGLARVSSAAAAIQGGDFDRRSGVTGSDEVGRLGSTFDEMVTRMQDELRRRQESEEAMRRFLADASHELRTPLTAVRGHVDVLRRGAATDPEDLGNALGDIHQSVVRMSRLVDDLLTLARLDRGGELSPAALPLKPILEEAARSGRHLAPEHPIAVEVENGAVARADADALNRILLNLIDNAGKYSPAGGTITLRARRENGHALVEVQDSGPGIPEAQRARIFERFFRGDSARTRRSGGAGLGLSICAALAERQGGSIRVASARGKGTTFTVELPIPQQSEPALSS